MIKIDENLKVITVFQDEHFACFLTDNFHTIIYSICLNFISNNSLICHVQDGVSYLTQFTVWKEKYLVKDRYCLLYFPYIRA